MLDALGIDTRAEHIYRMLLQHADWGVAELAASLSLSEAEVRAALDRLSELSLLRPSATEHTRLHPVSPELAMESLLARQQAELLAQQQKLETSRAAAAQLIADWVGFQPLTDSPGVETLVGVDRIRDRLAELSRHIDSEVMAFVPDAPDAQNIESAKPLDASLLSRGVRMRTLYPESVRNNPAGTDYANWLAAMGGEVRTTPDIPVRMTVMDRRVAILPVYGENSGHSAVLLTGDGTLTALCALFDLAWDRADPLGTARTRDERGLTSQERETLRLLEHGHTDEAIAKRLGISTRTTRRIVAGVMDTLGARSRFQAGALASQRGWLAAPVPPHTRNDTP
ncbi:helix-turn-helix transcriptional regulator [Streptomyces sp. NBC_00094]|uniref:helix-turn-helix domain-containing protein n=1 Tax=Streptomyces sp. NBC_00094 TaxID=2903620 RepID=UPI002254DD30|nr:helix-turn-helix transcriptional regulator [Streptomyces sp. NBC_00094]MCX5393840.1 helix-turn-helix transcriptional regulator [Streptomyces sp. NBC_00094]